MAIYNKDDLKTLRSNIITSNGVGNITGSNLGSFTDDFIDSIWFHADNSSGTADLGDLEVVGTSLRNILNTSTFIGLSNQVNIGSNTDINIVASNELDITSSNTLNVKSVNTSIYSANNFTFRINQPTPVNKILIDIFKVYLVGDTEVSGDLQVGGNVEVNGFTQSKFKSSDGTSGITETFLVSSPLLNKELVIKDGILTNIIDNGWDVQLDVFDQSTTFVIEGATIDIYPEQTAPPVGTPIASFTTNSIGRVTFKANPNSTYRLHIYKVGYDDIYPELIVNANPKLVNYSLPYTG